MVGFLKTCTVLGLFASLATVFGQTPVSGQAEFVRQFQSPVGVPDDSRRFFPQIDDSFSGMGDRPENPVPPISLEPGPIASSVVLGGISGGSRVRPNALFPGIGATGWTPPDPNIAVGPAYIVEVVNSDVAWFDKASGVKLFQQGMDGAAGWFGSVGATDFVFDPKCLYDPISQRFFVLALELQGSDVSKLLIAVSDDNNPAGTWFKYRIEAKLTIGTNTWWMDYPSLAVNKDGLAVCGNMFALSGGGGFGGVQFICLKKAPLLTGGATTVTSLRDANAGSAQVARSSDAVTDTVYGMMFSSASQMRVYALRNFLATPTVGFTDIPIPGFVPPTRPARSTNGHSLDSIDSRPFNCAYRAGRIYATHNTMVAGNDDRLTAKWYQVATNGWPVSGTATLEMAGSVPGPSVDHFMPAIGVNNIGDVALIFSRSSTSIIADVMVTSRKAGDPAGTMGAPIKLQGSVADYGGVGGNRWGDYFDVAVDPTDGLKFWGVGMIGNASGGWQTVIHSFSVSTPISTAASFDAISATMYDGSSFTGATSDVWAVDGSLFQVVARFVSNLGSIAAIETTYNIGVGVVPNVLGIKVKTASTLKTTGMWWLYNYTTNKYDHKGSWNQGTTMATPLTFSTTTNLANYVNGSGEVKVVVRTTTKPRQNSSYTLRADMIQLLAGVGAQGS